MLNADQFWHGSPSGEVGKVSAYGIHVGSRLAAKQALEARIGRRADGKDWDGSQEYGKTLLESTGQGYGVGDPGVPPEPHYPTGRAVYSDNTPVPLTARPSLFPVRIVGEMTNTLNTAHDDFRANGLMARQLRRGAAKRGYYYRNVGEDEGSISAVVPSPTHLKRAD